MKINVGLGVPKIIGNIHSVSSAHQTPKTGLSLHLQAGFLMYHFSLLFLNANSFATVID